MSAVSSDGAGSLDLADAIALLRDQIAEAQRRVSEGGDAGVRFGLGEITLELGLELAETRGAEGGLRFSVVSFGGKREAARSATHTVSVTLLPHGSDGGGVDVSDEDDA